MMDPNQQLAQLLQQDRRYRLDAYMFVFEAAQLRPGGDGHGLRRASEPVAGIEEEDDEAEGPQRHVTGQELCEAIRRFALQQFGLMAKTVLNSWGLQDG